MSFLSIFSGKKKSASGIALSDHALYFVRLCKTNDGITLEQWGTIIFDEGTMKNGAVENPALFSQALREANKKFHLGDLRVSLPENSAHLFRIHTDASSTNDLGMQIGFALESKLPFPSQQATFDFHPIRETEKGSIVQVTAVNKKNADQLNQHFKNRNIDVLGFELPARALARTVLRISDIAVCVADISRSQATLAIVSNGHIALSKTIFFNDLLPTPALEIAADAINDFLILWQSEKDPDGMPRERVEKIVLSGELAAAHGIELFFAERLRLPTVRADVWNVIPKPAEYIPDMHADLSLAYAAALGLALGVLQGTRK